MTVDTVLFCHYYSYSKPFVTANSINSNCIGDCFTELTFDAVPARYGPISVAIGYAIGPEDVGIDQTVRVALIGPDGVPPVPPRLPLQASPVPDTDFHAEAPLTFDYQVHITSLEAESSLRWQQINLKNLYFRSYGLCRCEVYINSVLNKSEELPIKPRPVPSAKVL
jgi:hypothetical protein